MRSRHLFAFAAALVAMAAARAWTADDAIITFRVVEQLAAGEGPVFNAGERVQVFTHPLWMLALAAWQAIGFSLFPGAMALGVALFAAGLAFLGLAFRDRPLALAVAATMVFFSRTLMDYATSALETPLSFALFAAALWALRRERRWLALTLMALLPLSRPDLFPWLLPFAWIAAPPRWKDRALAAALLVAPALAWAVFATIYYGAPLPNTALAKLGGDMGGRLDQGAAYIVASFVQDPGAAALTLAAIIVAARHRAAAGGEARIVRAGAASMALALAYVLWAGGDFMLGRFLLPLYWAALAVVLAGLPAAMAAPAVALLGALLVLTGQSTTVLRLGIGPGFALRDVAFAGAVDERRFWLPWFGAWSSTPALDRIATGQPPVASREPIVTGVLGIWGYLAPRGQLVVDTFALSDPFVARLQPVPNGRPGHAYRPLPREFWRWRDPAWSFGDARLDTLAGRLRLAHRAPDLWSAERWRAILALAMARQVPQDALLVSDEGERLRIEVKPAFLYRRATASRDYRVWLRVYERAKRRLDTGMTPEGNYDLVIGFECAIARVPPERNAAAAIPVRGDETLTMRCPKARVADGIVMRVGVREDRRGPAPIAYDETIAVTRPALWWIGMAPGWVVQGWRERPWPAVGAGIALLALGAWLGRRMRRR